MSDFQEYITALDLMDQTETATNPHEAWDDLYTHIYAHFPVPETASMVDVEWKEIRKHFECQDMVLMFKQTREEILEKLRSIPPVILAVSFPVWIARYLLRFANVNVGAYGLKTFDEFHRRYGNMVLASCY
jgi:hypothetical protein